MAPRDAGADVRSPARPGAGRSPTTRARLARSAARRGGTDAGFVGGFEGLLFGALIFIAGAMLVAGVWATIDTKLALAGAARLAATSYVDAANPTSAAGAALAGADIALQGWGLSTSEATV
ncbi:MAG: hypothetical protein M0T80_02305, partial [Actinomycetota bacterium]|nr:hypothetical protein [Actinomycetota bacterium]